jgi:hypothetical protein
MMCLDVLIFDWIPVEGNDTFQSEIEAHGGPRSASIRLDPPRVDFHWEPWPSHNIISYFFTIAALYFYFIPLVHIHTRLQYYVEHNENIMYRQAGGRGGRGQGRAEQVEGGEEGSDGVERQEGLKKNFVTKTGHVIIPTTESLGPRFEWAPIRSQNLRSICGYWTRPILGLQCVAK